MPDDRHQWAHAPPPDIYVSPASPRYTVASPAAVPSRAAAERASMSPDGGKKDHADEGSDVREPSSPGWTSGKAPPILQKRPSHASTTSASTPHRNDQPGPRVSFLGSIAAALPTFSLSGFRLPGAPTFETIEHQDDDNAEYERNERDYIARDEEEDEDETGSEVSSDERDDEDGDNADGGDFVLTRSDGPPPDLPRGGDGANEQVDLQNSPDLRIEDAVDGPSLVSDTPVLGTPVPPSTNASSAAKPGFPNLARTPSSAFVTASKEGNINPLTLHAIARRDSEQEAIRMVQARNETERRREDSAQSTVRGVGTGPHPQTPTQARYRSSTIGLGTGIARSESPAPISDDERAKLRKKRSTGLGRVQQEDARSFRTASSGGFFPRTATMSSTASGSRTQPHASTSQTVIPDRHRAVSDAHSLAPSQSAEPKRKKGFFSRFGKKNKDRTEQERVSSMSSLPANLQRQDLETGSLPSGSPVIEQTPPRAVALDTPRQPEKARAVKVKTRGKSHKDFGRLFLAQELVISPLAVPGHRPSVGSGQSGNDDESERSSFTGDNASIHSKTSRAKTDDGQPPAAGSGSKKRNAVWATKFSEDGRYFAVGGKDGVVRVWEVLSSPETRAATMNSSSTSHEPAPSHDSPNFARSCSTFAPSTPSSAIPPPPPTVTTGSGRKKGTPRSRGPACVLPVFASRPIREFVGHEADVLDLSWSKNNFLLSSSMDKTVRLWHVSRSECLCAFQHLDFVTSIAFHPKDDRFFLSGSLDCKLRLWNIPEKRVHIWTELPELITSVAFSRDGKFAIAGSFVGVCIFLEVETFRFHSMFSAKSTRGKNVKGKKVTSLCPFPLPSCTGDRLLVTTNDSRMRLYHVSDKIVEAKYAGHENTSSQIRASFSDDGRWIISGSEDRHVYIWDSGLGPTTSGGFHLKKKFKDGGGYETFAMPAHIVTSAVFAPTLVRMHLKHAGDPIFADGRTHLALLERTLSGNSLDLIGTQSRVSTVNSAGPSILDGLDRSDRNVLVPATTRDGNVVAGLDSAEHAIIVVADDETGIISVFRNSPIPSDIPVDGKRSRHDRGGSAGLGREKSKRWSRASAAHSDGGR